MTAIQTDVFLLADPQSDSTLINTVKADLEARQLSVAPVTDRLMITQDPDWRSTALGLLERAGCLVFLQTKSALAASNVDEDAVNEVESAGMFCGDMIHAAYEAAHEPPRPTASCDLITGLPCLAGEHPHSRGPG